MISAGGTHACAVNAAGEAFCWGSGISGRLGDGTPVATSTAVRVASPLGGPVTWRTVSAGRSHTCGVTTAGKAYCWGNGALGRLGNGLTTGSNTPVPVSGTQTWASISAGGAHTCGVTTGGDAFCWGHREGGRLGHGNAAAGEELTPVPVSGPATRKWSSISAGGFHTCGVTTGGDAFCWGSGTSGQLGNGASLDSAVPVPVTNAAALRWTSITAGDSHSCATSTVGWAVCWGSDDNGRMGNGAPPAANTGSSNVPLLVAGSTSAPLSGLSAGVAHTCGLTPAGAAFCFGMAADGRLGNNNATTDQQTLVVPFGMSAGVVAVDVGDAFSCALTAEGLARCWGENASGQVGDGSTVDRLVSFQVANYPGS